MPRQTNFETSMRQADSLWSALYNQARRTDLPDLPRFSELGALVRDELFRELGYTYWNRELVDALASRMRGENLERWVELAAGTGRLTAELTRRGVPIAATDDYSQAPAAVRGSQRAICYGPWVGRLSARDALSVIGPDAVVCAWPPLGSCLVPDLLAGQLAGIDNLRLVVCIGDPNGATEAPAQAYELPASWALESWPECQPWLAGFNDALDGRGTRSRLLIYRRQTRNELEGD